MRDREDLSYSHLQKFMDVCMFFIFYINKHANIPKLTANFRTQQIQRINIKSSFARAASYVLHLKKC